MFLLIRFNLLFSQGASNATSPNDDLSFHDAMKQWRRNGGRTGGNRKKPALVKLPKRGGGAAQGAQGTQGRSTLFAASIPSYRGTRSAARLLAMALMIVPYVPVSNVFFIVGFDVAERVMYVSYLNGYII